LKGAIAFLYLCGASKIKKKWNEHFANKPFDAIDNLIFTEGLRIEALDIHPELD